MKKEIWYAYKAFTPCSSVAYCLILSNKVCFCRIRTVHWGRLCGLLLYMWSCCLCFFYLSSIRNCPLNASWRCQCFPFLFSISNLGSLQKKSLLKNKSPLKFKKKSFRNTHVFQNARNAVSDELVPLSPTPWSRPKPLACSWSVFSLNRTSP